MWSMRWDSRGCLVSVGRGGTRHLIHHLSIAYDPMSGTLAGVHGSTPSNTSRYFSVDMGLVHLVALDFNLYYGNDPCTDCADAQLAWLHADLAKATANRDAVPWIALMAHYPVFCTGCAGNGDISAEYYASADAEMFGNVNASAARAFDARSALGERPTTKVPLKGASDNLVNDIAPILELYGVDLFLAGQ